MNQKFTKGNKKLGNENPFYGKKHSEQSKERMRQAKLRNPTKYWLGRKRPDISKLVSERQKGKPGKKGKEANNWKGGCSDWYHKEARKIMANYLKRELNSNEIVHHIDGDWKNNNLSNLFLTTRSAHIKEHLNRGDIKPGQYKKKNGA